jgi:hypothetical protein
MKRLQLQQLQCSFLQCCQPCCSFFFCFNSYQFSSSSVVRSFICECEFVERCEEIVLLGVDGC